MSRGRRVVFDAKPLTVRLPEDLQRFVSKEARRLGVTGSELLRSLIDRDRKMSERRGSGEGAGR